MSLSVDEVAMAGGYGVILADPPWSYQQGCMHGRGNADRHYPTMSPEQIAALPVARLAGRDAALFLWTTWPQIRHAFAVGEAWGFTYRTLGFLWVKRCRTADAPFWGAGFWNRSNSEPCLLFVRGSPRRKSGGVHQLVGTDEPAILCETHARHSAKPPAIRDKIVELLGDVPRLELFARERVSGWDAWGNEIDSDVEMTCG